MEKLNFKEMTVKGKTTFGIVIAVVLLAFYYLLQIIGIIPNSDNTKTKEDVKNVETVIKAYK